MDTIINFTYTSPQEDMEKCLGHNPDGSINIRYTLLAHRQMLEKNVERINKLLDVSNDITSLSPVGISEVEIVIKSESIKQTLISENVIKTVNDDTSEDENEINISSDEETNYERLSKINKMTNSFQLGDSSGTSDDEDNEDLPVDDNNIEIILGKYLDIIDRSDHR